MRRKHHTTKKKKIERKEIEPCKKICSNKPLRNFLQNFTHRSTLKRTPSNVQEGYSLKSNDETCKKIIN